MLEALVYKCVHLDLRGLSSSYRQRTEDYEDRLLQLADAGVIPQATWQLGRKLYSTRCEFAHSLKPADNLTYMGLPLRDRRKLKRYFLPDVYRFTEVLLGVFKPVQHEQIDTEVLRRALYDAAGKMSEAV